MSIDTTPTDDQFTPEETAARMARALKRALNMPHKPQIESSGKKKRPAKKGRARKAKG